MICGSVSSAQVKANGFMLMPYRQVPQIELRYLEKEKKRAKETIRRAHVRLRNIARRTIELRKEITWEPEKPESPPSDG